MAVLRGKPNCGDLRYKKHKFGDPNGARLKACGEIARAFVGLLLLCLFASHLATCDAAHPKFFSRETVSRTDKTFGAWSPVGISKTAIGRKFNIGTEQIGRALGIGQFANVASKWTEGCIYTKEAGFFQLAVVVAVDETAILLHPPQPLVGASIVMERERQQNDSLVNG